MVSRKGACMVVSRKGVWSLGKVYGKVYGGL